MITKIGVSICGDS